MAREFTDIDISQIDIDRYPLNPTVLGLIDYLRAGGITKPIKVAKKSSGGYILKDGRHRVLAYKLLGRTTIKATFSDVALLDVGTSSSLSDRAGGR